MSQVQMRVTDGQHVAVVICGNVADFIALLTENANLEDPSAEASRRAQ